MAGATAAQAGTFKLTLTDMTDVDSTKWVTVVITDNGIGDSDDGTPTNVGPGSPDSIIYSTWADPGFPVTGKVGRFTVDVIGTVYGLDGLPSPTTAPVQMDLSNFLLHTETGGKFQATLERTGVPDSLFGDAVKGIADFGASFDGGTTGTVMFQSWVNGQTIFNPAGTIPPTPENPTVEYSPIYVSGPLTLKSQLTWEISAGSAEANTALRVENVQVPEPTTLLLFGPGMVGLAALRRRLRSKAE
jgi:hypothetical protein